MSNLFTKMALIMIIGLVLSSVGCKSSVNNSSQSIRKYNRVSNINRMLLANDIEKLMLLDRPSRLTRWHVVAE